MADDSPESEGSCAVDLKETELTLCLPGDCAHGRATGSAGGLKRGHSFRLDLNLSGGSAGRRKFAGGDLEEDEEASSAPKPPNAKAQLVGWPPVRAPWKNTMKSAADCKYVKVAVDGAPYLRKVNLEMYNSYQQLLKALEDLFSSFTIRNYFNDGKLMDPVNGSEYVLTYEDKDGDWMMVGDVPWKMFVEPCKRLRLMKSSEATGFVPRTPPN